MLFNFSGAYAEWNYEDIESLNYCPYTPFLFSFIVLILSCLLIGLFLTGIICFICARGHNSRCYRWLNDYCQNRLEVPPRNDRVTSRIDYECLE